MARPRVRGDDRGTARAGHDLLRFSMVWIIVVANIIVVAVSLLFINHLAKLTTIQGIYIIPWILLLCFIGAYTANNHGVIAL